MMSAPRPSRNLESAEILLDVTGTHDENYQIFALGFAWELGPKIFMRETPLQRSVFNRACLQFPNLAGRVEFFVDWMSIFESVKAGQLLAMGIGDVITGMADRMGIRYLPIPMPPVNWCLDQQADNKTKCHKIRIAVVGPESSGKSTLAKFIAEHFKCIYVEEYARFFYDFFGIASAQLSDVELIVAAQTALEGICAMGLNDLLICDTEPRQSILWSKVIYGQVDEDLEQFAANRTYDAFLVTRPDLPWIQDGQRCLPNGSERFFSDIYESIISSNKPVFIISGNGSARTEGAIEFINKIIKTSRAHIDSGI